MASQEELLKNVGWLSIDEIELQKSIREKKRIRKYLLKI